MKSSESRLSDSGLKALVIAQGLMHANASCSHRQCAAAVSAALFKLVVQADQDQRDLQRLQQEIPPAVATAQLAQDILSRQRGMAFNTLADTMRTYRKILPGNVAKDVDLLNKAASYSRHKGGVADLKLLQRLEDAVASLSAKGDDEEEDETRKEQHFCERTAGKPAVEEDEAWKEIHFFVCKADKQAAEEDKTRHSKTHFFDYTAGVLAAGEDVTQKETVPSVDDSKPRSEFFVGDWRTLPCDGWTVVHNKVREKEAEEAAAMAPEATAASVADAIAELSASQARQQAALVAAISEQLEKCSKVLEKKGEG
jgi:hypothetical protein